MNESPNESPMHDSLDEFESELSRLRPRALSRELTGRIAATLDQPQRWSFADRCLATFMGSGALAASVIVGLLVWQVLDIQTPRASPPLTIVVQHPPASIGEYQQALARTNAPGLEIFR